MAWMDAGKHSDLGTSEINQGAVAEDAAEHELLFLPEGLPPGSFAQPPGRG
jgi:hypothetical protein